MITVTPSVAVITVMLAMVPAMTFAVARRVLILVPAILHEVDRLAARVVLAAILAPILRVFRRYPQVHRLANHAHRRRLDHDRLRIDDLRLRGVTDVGGA